jgi:hypothetical protein
MHLRFSIRDLFWLTLVATLLMGWWLEHRHVAQIDDELKSVRMQRNAEQDEIASYSEKLREVKLYLDRLRQRMRDEQQEDSLVIHGLPVK